LPQDDLYELKAKPAKEEITLNEPLDESMELVFLLDGNFDEEHDDRILSFLTGRFTEMDSSRPDDHWDLRHKQFEAVTNWNGDNTARTNLPIEKATIRNKMADSLAERPNIKYKPTEPDDVKKVSVTSKLFDFVWNEADTDEELFDLYMGAYIYGTYPWYEYLHTERRTRFTPVYGKDGKIGHKKEEQTKSWLKGRAWDIRDVWMAPVHRIEEAPDCFIQERDMTYDQIKQLENDPNYRNIEEALKNPYNGNISEPFQTTEELYNGESFQNKYRKMSYYNIEKGILIETINFNVVIRETANPYPHGELPISFLTDHKRLNEIYGTGECEILESTKFERNTTRNQIVDFVRGSNTYALAVGGGVALDSTSLVSGINQLWSFDGDISGAQYLKPPAMDGGLIQLDELQRNDATWMTGIDNNSLAGAPTKTAFEARLQEVTKLKGIGISMKLADFFYTRMARQRLANMQAFMPTTTGKKIIGTGEFRTIALEGVQKDLKGIKDGVADTVGVEIEDKQDSFTFLEITPQMIQSNIDIQVTTPSTTPIMRELDKFELREFMKSMTEMASVKPEIFEELGFDSKAFIMDQIEGFGFNADKYFTNEKGQAEDQKKLRAGLVEDLPLPFKAQTQPERNNRDELAQVAGENLQGQTATETR